MKTEMKVVGHTMKNNIDESFLGKLAELRHVLEFMGGDDSSILLVEKTAYFWFGTSHLSQIIGIGILSFILW